MLRELLEVNKKNTKLYQVLFLKNDGDQSVEVEEVEQIDFVKIKEHLERGDSVFITNRRTQKIKIPKPKKKAKAYSINSKTANKVSRKTVKGTSYFDPSEKTSLNKARALKA